MKLHDIESIAKHFNIEYDTSAYMTNGFLIYKNIRIVYDERFSDIQKYPYCRIQER